LSRFRSDFIVIQFNAFCASFDECSLPGVPRCFDLGGIAKKLASVAAFDMRGNGFHELDERVGDIRERGDGGIVSVRRVEAAVERGDEV